MLTHLIYMLRVISLFFLVSLSGVTLCYAYCDNNMYQGPYNHFIDFGSVTIPANIVKGDIIASKKVYPSNIHIGGCHAGNLPYLGTFIGPYSTNIPSVRYDVYSTNVAGVGISASYSTRTDDIPYIPLGHFGTTDYYSYPSDFGLYDIFTVTFNLIKTGNISSGLLSPGEMSMLTADGVATTTYTVTGGTIIAPTCSVVTSSSNAVLGNHLTTDFTGAGSATASVVAPVQLNCPESGMKVFVTLSATPDTSTVQSGAIKVSPSSGLTAGGIAIQMLDSNNNGIPLNSQIQYITTAQGTFDFGWKARYLQTGSTVTAGDANASATISLTYQ